VYFPLGLIFSHKADQPCSWLYLTLQTLTWDWPLMNWMYFCNLLGRRALGPFISEIDGDIYIGSLPFASDVAAMSAPISEHGVSQIDSTKSSKRIGYNIGAVINMCRETTGPQNAYDKAGIMQYRSRTPDINEPSYNDIIEGVGFIRAFLRSQERKAEKISADVTTKKRVLIHCKAGRGRSACMALCYYISEGMKLEEAFAKIKDKRSVVEVQITKFKVVKRLIKELEDNRGNFDRLVITLLGSSSVKGTKKHA
jgi:atypical dual specificity phosphatase